jgi:hypothetical protein
MNIKHAIKQENHRLENFPFNSRDNGCQGVNNYSQHDSKADHES